MLLVSAHTSFCSKDAGQGLREAVLFQLILTKHCFCIINACTIWGAKKLAIATYIKMFVIINGFYKSLVHFFWTIGCSISSWSKGCVTWCQSYWTRWCSLTGTLIGGEKTDSSWEFLRMENKQIKTVQNNSYG